MKSEDLMVIIANMGETERVKLLELLYAKYFDNGQPTEKREMDIQALDEYGDPHLKEHNEGYE